MKAKSYPMARLKARLLAAIRRHCDARGYKGEQRAQVIREYRRLLKERGHV